MTLAHEYAKLHMNTDLFFSDYKEYDKRKREFISKNAVSHSVFHGAGWFGWNVIFKDGTSAIFSSDIARKFSTDLTDMLKRI